MFFPESNGQLFTPVEEIRQKLFVQLDIQHIPLFSMNFILNIFIVEFVNIYFSLFFLYFISNGYVDCEEKFSFLPISHVT
jgi:hypothetical protein